MKEIVIVFEMNVDCISEVTVVCDTEKQADEYIEFRLKASTNIIKEYPRLKKVYYKVKGYENS